jgi:sugar lactone lactonase YvrE
MALWNNLTLWKRLESVFRRRKAARWGGTRSRHRTLALEGLEHRLCPSPVLLVADGNGNQVLAYDANTGAFRGVFVAPGDGGLDAPDLGIIGGPDGNVYVDSYGSGPNPVNSVMRYDGTTGALFPSAGRTGANFVTPNDGGLQGTEGLAFGGDGLLYVANDTTQPEYGGVPGDILRFDGTTGDFVGVFVPSGSGGLSYANDLHFGPDGNLYVNNADGAGKNSGRILRYDAATGEPLPSAGRDGANFITPNDGGLAWANGFTFGPDGMLYVANDFIVNGRSNILRFDGTTGDFVDVFVSGGLGFVDGIVWGPDGNLYVTNNRGRQASVNRYDPAGNLIDVFIAPNDGGLQFSAGLLFWDLPDASAPPGRPNALIVWGDSHSSATQGVLASPVASDALLYALPGPMPVREALPLGSRPVTETRDSVFSVHYGASGSTSLAFAELDPLASTLPDRVATTATFHKSV